MTRERIKEAYRLALAEGHVAYQRSKLRRGEVVKFRIDDDVGFSDGIPRDERVAVIGEFQLRYVGNGPFYREYAIYGRAEGQIENDWFMVDGPWPGGAGPFDRKQS